MRFDLDLFLGLLFSSHFLKPAWTTFWVTVVAMSGGVVLGFLGALARGSSSAWLRAPVGAYLWLFRGTPLVVQIIFWYDATAEISNNVINLPALTAGIIALAVQEGAYMTEIIRAGLLSVDKSQREAACALGMTRGQIMRRIVIRQAIRIVLPPLGNQFINMLKATSLLFTIGVPELFATGTNFYSRNFRYFEVLSVVSIWYLMMTTILTLLQQRLERRFAIGPPLGSLRGIRRAGAA